MQSGVLHCRSPCIKLRLITIIFFLCCCYMTKTYGMSQERSDNVSTPLTDQWCLRRIFSVPHSAQLSVYPYVYEQTNQPPRSLVLWNRVPSDTCYLAPDSFKLELSKINLICSRSKFLSHHTARSYFLKLTYIHTAQGSSAHDQHPQRDITLQQSWRLYWKKKKKISVILHQEVC